MVSENFSAALQIMGLGMAGIFVFMLLFWAVITLLHRFFPGKENKES